MEPRTNRHKPGNMAVLVNTSRTGLRKIDDVIETTASAQQALARAMTFGKCLWTYAFLLSVSRTFDRSSSI